MTTVNGPELPEGYLVEFPRSWGIYRTLRGTMRDALQAVVDLEASRGMVAERLTTPSGHVLQHEDIAVFVEKFGITYAPAAKENRWEWIAVFGRDGDQEEFTFSDQLGALKFIASGEDMDLIEATEIIAPNGHVVDRAGIDAALERNGLVSK